MDPTLSAKGLQHLLHLNFWCFLIFLEVGYGLKQPNFWLNDARSVVGE